MGNKEMKASRESDLQMRISEICPHLGFVQKLRLSDPNAISPSRGGDAAEGGEGVAHTDFLCKAPHLWILDDGRRLYRQAHSNRRRKPAGLEIYPVSNSV